MVEDRGVPSIEPRDDVESRLHAIWSELLPGRSFGVTDSFFDVGGHSLLAIRLLARVEASFGREAAGGRRSPARGHDRGPGNAVPARSFGPRRLVRRSCRSGREAREFPFFCVHPAGGTVYGFHELAHHLGDDRSVFGLQAAGLEEWGSPRRPISGPWPLRMCPRSSPPRPDGALSPRRVVPRCPRMAFEMCRATDGCQRARRSPRSSCSTLPLPSREDPGSIRRCSRMASEANSDFSATRRPSRWTTRLSSRPSSTSWAAGSAEPPADDPSPPGAPTPADRHEFLLRSFRLDQVYHQESSVFPRARGPFDGGPFCANVLAGRTISASCAVSRSHRRLPGKGTRHPRRSLARVVATRGIDLILRDPRRPRLDVPASPRPGPGRESRPRAGNERRTAVRLIRFPPPILSGAWFSSPSSPRAVSGASGVRC